MKKLQPPRSNENRHSEIRPDKSVRPTDVRGNELGKHPLPTQHYGVRSSELDVRFRHSPHWQLGGCVYFVTFRSSRGPLPEKARHQTALHVLHDHGSKYRLIFGVIMPDHVHLLLQPLETGPGTNHDLADIMKGIKGTSSRRINQMLETSGTVWQEGYFDRIVRDEGELQKFVAYMLNNPVKAGLVDDPQRYESFVRPPERT